FIGASGATFGGTASGAGNTISGNTGGGMSIAGTGNFVLGNFIGTTPGGATLIGNGNDGIFISGNNNTIGGTAAGAGNVISGNTAGIDTSVSTATSGLVVQGNKIGTNAAGLAAIANGGAGIALNNASNSVIGGTSAAAQNIISGNGDTGIVLAASNGI